MNDLLVEIIGGLIVGASLGLVGAGGAILSVPIFDVLLAHETKESVAEALLVTGAIAAAAALRAATRRNVDWPRVALVGVPGIIGGMLGGMGAHLLSDEVQMALFCAVALLAAWRMAATPGTPGAPQPSPVRGVLSSPVVAVEAILVGLGLGLLSGLVGVGGGFLLVPALVLLMKLPMHRAVGTSLAIIALNCAAGYAGNRIGDGATLHVAWKGVAIVALCGVLGSLAGAHWSTRLPQHVLRRVFAVVIVLAALLVATTQLWQD